MSREFRQWWLECQRWWCDRKSIEHGQPVGGRTSVYQRGLVVRSAQGLFSGKSWWLRINNGGEIVVISSAAMFSVGGSFNQLGW